MEWRQRNSSSEKIFQKNIDFFFTLWYLIVQFFFQIFDYRGDPKKILIELGPLYLSEDLVDNMVIWEAQCTPGQPHIYI